MNCLLPDLSHSTDKQINDIFNATLSIVRFSVCLYSLQYFVLNRRMDGITLLDSLALLKH